MNYADSSMQCALGAALEVANRPKYHTVNGRWPAGTNEGRSLKPTPQEALSAVKRLYRVAFGKPFKGKMKLTSGNRFTYIRSGVFYVNPDYRGGGWHELVHGVSHTVSRRLHPNAPGHGHQHAFIEKQLITEVVNRGWLEGKLARAKKPKKDPKVARAERAQASIKRWQTKEKLAKTKLKKLRAALKRYEKQGIISQGEGA